MAEQQLDCPEIGAALEQMHGKGVAQGVQGDRLGDVGVHVRSASVLHRGAGDRLTRQIAGEQPLLWRTVR